VPDSTPDHAAALREQIARLEKENALLREKLEALARRVFGVKSEKLDPAQLHLLLQGLDEPGKAPEPVGAEAPQRSQVPSPSRSRTPRLPDHLPFTSTSVLG